MFSVAFIRIINCADRTAVRAIRIGKSLLGNNWIHKTLGVETTNCIKLESKTMKTFAPLGVIF